MRRPLEAMATTVPLFLLLAIPILVNLGEHLLLGESRGGRHLHRARAAHPAQEAQLPERRLLRRPHGRLLRGGRRSSPGGCSAWSTRQDASGDPALTQKQRNLGTGALPLMAMVITFAGFDWLMSLNPIWFSTIFGVYYFAGSFWSTSPS